MRKISLMILIVLFSTLFSNAYANVYYINKTSHKTHKAQHHSQHRYKNTGYTVIPVPHFSAIHIDDDINVEILSGQGQQKVEVRGNDYVASQLVAHVSNHVLYLSRRIYNREGERRLFVKIWTNDLSKLYAGGSSAVYCSGLSGGSGITILMAGNCGVKLNGLINLRKIQNDSSGNVKVWVNSHYVVVRGSGTGSITLEGVADTLDARLGGSTMMDACYLGANQVYVTTTEDASAHVLAIEDLNAFAGGNSNIYYYKTPKHIIRSTRQSGNVLQMSY